MTSMVKISISWLLIILASIYIFSTSSGEDATDNILYSTFSKKVVDGDVISTTIENSKATGKYKVDGKIRQYNVTIPENYPDLTEKLLAHNVAIKVEKDEPMPFILSLLLSWFPMLLLIGLWIFFMKKQSGRGNPFSHGQSKMKTLNPKMGHNIDFDDVAGCDEAKQEVTEIIDFLKEPGKFTRLGGKIPKGVLLIGPPGTGKTLLAKAIAGEAKVPFFSISGSDFVEMFVGVGASRVRDMFDTAKKHAPCIIFVDEIDAMGRHRSGVLSGGSDEREQTLNQMLVEMDGFGTNDGIILIAATNRPDVLDPALLRPGRFDRQVVVPRPDLLGREQILKVHVKKVPTSNDVNIKSIARGTPGFSGADLANLVNEAALNAARLDKECVDKDDFETAKDKVMMGAERRSMIISEDQKKTTAYHEAGHALVAKNLKNADPVHKVSIIPRGQALGVTMQLPEEDRYNHDRDYLTDQIAIMMGGRLAEELVLKQMTTGASNDLERATQMARKMVMEWGMSDEMGIMVYTSRETNPFFGMEASGGGYISEDTSKKIDEIVRKILDREYDRAKSILEENIGCLHRLAEALIKYETLDEDGVNRAIEMPNEVVS